MLPLFDADVSAAHPAILLLQLTHHNRILMHLARRWQGLKRLQFCDRLVALPTVCEHGRQGCDERCVVEPLSMLRLFFKECLEERPCSLCPKGWPDMTAGMMTGMHRGFSGAGIIRNTGVRFGGSAGLCTSGTNTEEVSI